MEDTRYAPPAAADLLVQKEPAWLSGPPPPRPIAIWVMAVVQLLFVGVMAVGALRGFELVQSGSVAPGAWLLRVLIVVIFAAVFGVTMFGMWRRRSWSRWPGLALIALLALASMFAPDTTVYANDSERNGGLFAKVLISPLLCLWWAYALAFSTKARRYFGLLQDQ